jgi:hypothetical protein
MRIDTIEDLERVLELTDRHRIDTLIIGDVTIRRSVWSAVPEASVDRELVSGGETSDDEDELLYWSADS